MADLAWAVGLWRLRFFSLGVQAIWSHGFALVVVWFLGPMWPWPGMATGATIKSVSPVSPAMVDFGVWLLARESLAPAS